MRRLFGLLIAGALFAVGGAIFGGLDASYQVADVAVISGTELLVAGLAVLGGSVAALNSTILVMTSSESGPAEQRVYRPPLVVVAVGLLGIAGYIVFTGSSSVLAGSLTIGDCFDDPGAEVIEVSQVDFVACSDPHDFEVYATPALTDIGGFYLGELLLDDQSQGLCLDRFEAFVGTPYAVSALDIAWLFPSEDSWSEGDRTATCAVYRLDGQKMIGSMQASGN